MSKIAIISQPDQGVLIDVGGCSTMQEAIEHLSSTLQVSSQFWKGVSVALNLGKLELQPMQVAQILAIAKGVGAYPQQVFSVNETTRSSLQQHNVRLGEGRPMSLPVLTCDLVPTDVENDDVDGDELHVQSADEDTTHLYITEEAADFDTAIPDAIQEEAQEQETSQAEPPKKPAPQLPAVLFLRQNLRSGQTVSHKGHLVIVGDVNPGAEIMAEGDIVVWGALRGIAHAGIGGNTSAEIRAIKLQPVQIRIAHAIARSPDRPRVKWSSMTTPGPETARMVDGKIRITRSKLD